METTVVLRKQVNIFKKAKSWMPIAGLLMVFFLSRMIYDRLGFEFQSEGIYDYWQMIDPLLLQTDLWRSLWYLHSQPPMLNLTTGAVLQVFPNAYHSVFHDIFLVTGLVLAWSVYQLGIGLGLPRGLSFVASAFFTISPPVVLYEHWLFYTYPVAAALVLSGVALHRFVLTKKSAWGVLFFSTLAFVALSWSLFHLLWLILIVCGAFFILPNRKTVALTALIPLTLVIGWYTKNFVLFGEFTASTWAGMNLSNATTYRLSSQETLRMIEAGKLSAFAEYESFNSPESYLNLLPDTPITSIPLLDMTRKSIGKINFHHLVYVETGNYYWQDALHVIRTHPTLYLRSILQSWYIFFHSVSDYDFLDHNRKHILAFEKGWNRIFFGQWEMNETLDERTHDLSALHVGWWILLALFVALVGTSRYVWKQRRVLNDAKTLLVLFMGFNIVYLALTGNLFDLGENNRFRFVVDSFVLLLFLFVIVNAIHVKRISEAPQVDS